MTPLPNIAYDPETILDRKVNAGTFASHVAKQEPFCHLRYGDGEFVSALNLGRKIKKISNCDGHRYYSDTMGVELKQVLHEVAERFPLNSNIYVGLHCTWHQQYIQPWIVENRLMNFIHWVGNIELQVGLANLSTLRLFEAIKNHSGPTILIGNDSLAPAARALRATLIEIPRKNCWHKASEIVEQAQNDIHACDVHNADAFPIVMASASMASEPILWRLRKWRPVGIYLDTGHIFDAIVSRPSRGYTRSNKDGINDIIKQHYQPFFLGS